MLTFSVCWIKMSCLSTCRLRWIEVLLASHDSTTKIVGFSRRNLLNLFSYGEMQGVAVASNLFEAPKQFQ